MNYSPVIRQSPAKRTAPQSNPVSARTAMTGQDIKNDGGRREKYENIRDVTICAVYHIPRMTPFLEFLLFQQGYGKE
jgi:hypothetical protein